MDDTDRILGRLEEHKDQTNSRLDRIEAGIGELQAFRWRLLGASGLISVVIGTLFNAFFKQ